MQLNAIAQMLSVTTHLTRRTTIPLPYGHTWFFFDAFILLPFELRIRSGERVDDVLCYLNA